MNICKKPNTLRESDYNATADKRANLTPKVADIRVAMTGGWDARNNGVRISVPGIAHPL